MADGTLQADYDQLTRIAAGFGRASADQSALIHSVTRHMAPLRSTWEGAGSQSFFSEMEGDILPAQRRLQEALSEAQRVTQQIIQTFRAAEAEAARLFAGRDPGGASDGGWTEPGSGGDSTGGPSLLDRIRAGLEWIDDKIGTVVSAIATFLDEFFKRMPDRARELMHRAVRWILDNTGRYGPDILKWAKRARLIPIVGDAVPIIGGLIDVGRTWYQNSGEYLEILHNDGPVRAAAAVLVDGIVAALPAAGDIIGGKLGILGGGLIGGAVTVEAGGVGAIPVAIGGEIVGGELGNWLGELARDWVRADPSRRDVLIDGAERALRWDPVVGPIVRGVEQLWKFPQGTASSPLQLSFTF